MNRGKYEKRDYTFHSVHGMLAYKLPYYTIECNCFISLLREARNIRNQFKNYLFKTWLYQLISSLGFDSIFNTILCENERYWRQANGFSNERYVAEKTYGFDECHNGWTMPNVPSDIGKFSLLFYFYTFKMIH